MLTGPWPMRVGDLLLREAVEEDLDGLLALRNDPDVNRFMIHTSAEPEDGMGQPGKPRLTQAGIGCVVDPAFAGRGVASDLARALLAAAFDHLGLRRVTAGRTTGLSFAGDTGPPVRHAGPPGSLVPPATPRTGGAP